MSVIKATFGLLAIGLLAACTSTPVSDPPAKPYSSLFGEASSCELGQTCDYTGQFERQSATDTNIPDALFTYDDDHKCVLIVTDQTGLLSFDKEQEGVNFSGDEISISGKAIERSSLNYWSTSSFCKDSHLALTLESVDAVIVMYHER